MVFTQTLEVTGDMVETEWQDSVLTNRTTPWDQQLSAKP